ncbi:regulation of nuclear pre-mRNA domain-containing protein 1B isoform 3-T3 [Sylvia borin]
MVAHAPSPPAVRPGSLRRSVRCRPSPRGGVRARAAILWWRPRRVVVGEAAPRPPRGRSSPGPMSSFSESALEKKLSELSNSQQSVQTLSLWLIHHRKHAGPIVAVWHRELRKVAEEKKSLKRTFQQIQEEEDDDYPGSYSPQDPSAGPLLTEDLIKALQDLENAASGDATVRQKIASLPQEVQDVSLLEKITDKEAAERLSKTVDEACLLLAEYNGRLAAELEDRRQLARMLIEYTQNQKDVLTEKEKKLEEYKQKLARVTQVRKELKSHIQSLPDLSLLPNVTGGLAPLPSAGDLFSTD